MTYYINRRAGRYHETVDEYNSKSEANQVLPDYQQSEHGRAYYYISALPLPNWKD